jgi:hypothetical protein
MKILAEEGLVLILLHATDHFVVMKYDLSRTMGSQASP